MLQAQGLRAAAGGGDYTPPEPGELISSKGGYFAGHMRSEDGQTVYQLIVAEKSTETNIRTTDVSITTSEFQNTQRNSQSHGYTNNITKGSLTHNGFNDWYIPSVQEMHQMYRFLRPSPGSIENAQGTNDSGFAVNIDWYRNTAAAPSWYPGNYDDFKNPNPVDGGASIIGGDPDNVFGNNEPQRFEWQRNPGETEYYVYETSTIVDQVSTPVNANQKARVHMNWSNGEIFPYEYTYKSSSNSYKYTNQESTRVITRYVRRVPLNISPEKIDELYNLTPFKSNDYQDGSSLSYVSYRAEILLVGAGGQGYYSGGGAGGQANVWTTTKIQGLNRSAIIQVGESKDAAQSESTKLTAFGFYFVDTEGNSIECEGGGRGGPYPDDGGGAVDQRFGVAGTTGGARTIDPNAIVEGVPSYDGQVFTGGTGGNGSVVTMSGSTVTVGAGGGGGGAVGDGSNGIVNGGLGFGGKGGIGLLNDFETGVSQYYGHGGGGWGSYSAGAGGSGTGGLPNGARGGVGTSGSNIYGEAGRNGYGGGGGGSYDDTKVNGGRGVIIIRVPAHAGDEGNAGVELYIPGVRFGLGGLATQEDFQTVTEWGPYRTSKIFYTPKTLDEIRPGGTGAIAVYFRFS